jgi:hypothetical protein
MNSKLTYKEIIMAVLIGTTIGLATVFMVPSSFEIIVWLVLVFVLSIFAKTKFKVKIYTNTFLLAALCGMFVTLTHLFFLDNYLQSHQSEIAGLDQIKINNSYRLTLLAIAPIYWIVLGFCTCLVVFIINKFTVKKSS